MTGAEVCETNSDTLMIAFFKEFFQFLKVRKKLWLIPILMIALIIGALLIFSQGSVLAPFIYTLF